MRQIYEACVFSPLRRLPEHIDNRNSPPANLSSDPGLDGGDLVRKRIWCPARAEPFAQMIF
jgi:hypothetical protein